jgi:hypothetical protein
MKRISPHWLIFLLLSLIFYPEAGQKKLLFAATLQSSREREAQVLYKRFLDNYKGGADAQAIAYQAAKEYLQKYGDVSADVSDYFKKWIAIYERAIQQQEQQSQRQAIPQTRIPNFTFRREPELGMVLPGKPPQFYTGIITTAPIPDPDKQGQWLGTGMPTPGFDAQWAGIRGVIGTDLDNWVITYIATSDPAFRTSEGLKVGDSASEVLKVSGGEVIKENDYVFSVKLQSGWYARFLQADYNASGKLIQNANSKLRPETTILRFYKKSNAQSSVEETIVGTVIAESTSITTRGNNISHRLIVRVGKPDGRKPVNEFIIVRNVYKSEPAQNQPTDPRAGVRTINGPNLSRSVVELKQPLELKLTRDESCDATLEDISYGYIGTVTKDGQRGMERMSDLRYVIAEEMKRVPKNAKLPCYVLKADEYRLLKK